MWPDLSTLGCYCDGGGAVGWAGTKKLRHGHCV